MNNFSVITSSSPQAVGKQNNNHDKDLTQNPEVMPSLV